MNAVEEARHIMHLDALIRLHVSRDCTLHITRIYSLDSQDRDGLRFTVTRPCGAGREIVARGDYEEIVTAVTSRRGAGGPANAPKEGGTR